MSRKQEDIRKLILSKYLENPTIKFRRLAIETGSSIRTVSRTINKYRKGQTLQRKSGSGRKPGPVNKKLAKKIKQKFDKNPNTSVRDMANIVGTSTSYVQKIKKYYGLRSFKVQKVPDRSEDKERIAKTRARKLYERYLTKFDCIVIDDETYCKADFKSLPGHEFYTSKKKGEADKQYSTKKIGKFPRQYMVWQAICKCGLRSSEFVTTGTINSKKYIEECLEKRLLPFIREHSGSVLFWPDLATSHYATTTMEWYKRNNINIVPKEANPPNCPELRPIERYWALMKRSLNKTKKEAKSDVDFKNKWKRAYREVTNTTVQNLMRGLNKKVKNFFSSK